MIREEKDCFKSLKFVSLSGVEGSSTPLGLTRIY